MTGVFLDTTRMLGYSSWLTVLLAIHRSMAVTRIGRAKQKGAVMRVYYTLTLLGAVIRGRKWDKLEIKWNEPHIPRCPYAIPLAWAATREYVLTYLSDVTELEDAHLEIAFP